MLAQETVRLTATTAQAEAAEELMAAPEAAVSDAPLPAPEGAGALLLGLLLSPKEPKPAKEK
ncbi:hypothetical protein [Streptomyces aidingensis]|uniref:Uncharacterized protein n=1 Tax=Streptomyces aidingensis TaxID=910347 RepID=A0A1I1ILS9_9ACTN|nr:hypothetical protein [Streptomyces aidingensis]SFC36901.1 hypothetical protein SAMN05421773_10399 [Streptomyces aidingensis]